MARVRRKQKGGEKGVERSGGSNEEGVGEESLYLGGGQRGMRGGWWGFGHHLWKVC